MRYIQNIYWINKEKLPNLNEFSIRNVLFETYISSQFSFIYVDNFF